MKIQKETKIRSHLFMAIVHTILPCSPTSLQNTRYLQNGRTTNNAKARLGHGGGTVIIHFSTKSIRIRTALKRDEINFRISNGL